MHHENVLENVFLKVHGKDMSENPSYSSFMCNILDVFFSALSVSEEVVFCLNAIKNQSWKSEYWTPLNPR